MRRATVQTARVKNRMVVVCVALLTVAGGMFGCKPDKMAIEIYTSDIQKTIKSGVLEVPMTATFKIMGKDKDGVLPKAKAVAQRNLGDKAEFKISKGAFGDVMVVKSSVPMGNARSLQDFLAKNPRPFALTIVDESKVTFDRTRHFEALNEELKAISYMLQLRLPARNTVLRFVGDLENGPEITALAVFCDNKAELVFRQNIARRETVEIEYRGGNGSVYSQLPVTFSVKF